MILDESGYTAMWQNDKTPEAPGRLENLKELVKALEGFENLQGFLEHVSLIMDNESDDQEPKVTLMTLHAAKGLEYPAVFLPGWEDGLFPVATLDGRTGPEGAGGGTASGLCRHHPGRADLHDLLRRQPAGLRPVAIATAQPVHRRAARGACRGADAAGALRSPGRHGRRGGVWPIRAGGPRGAGRCLQFSPGWRRLHANQGARGTSQPRESRTFTIDAEAVSAFTIGERVFHQKFGYGRVEGVEGDKLEIAFDKAGVKRVVGRFLVAADAADDVPF